MLASGSHSVAGLIFQKLPTLYLSLGRNKLSKTRLQSDFYRFPMPAKKTKQKWPPERIGFQSTSIYFSISCIFLVLLLFRLGQKKKNEKRNRKKINQEKRKRNDHVTRWDRFKAALLQKKETAAAAATITKIQRNVLVSDLYGLVLTYVIISRAIHTATRQGETIIISFLLFFPLSLSLSLSFFLFLLLSFFFLSRQSRFNVVFKCCLHSLGVITMWISKQGLDSAQLIASVSATLTRLRALSQQPERNLMEEPKSRGLSTDSISIRILIRPFVINQAGISFFPESSPAGDDRVTGTSASIRQPFPSFLRWRRWITAEERQEW